MLFDYLAEVNERYKEKIYEGDYRLIFIDKHFMKSSLLSLSKVDKNIIEI